MGTQYDDDRSPRATWLPQLVSVIMDRFGDRIGRVRPATALLAAERAAIELRLDSVVRMLPLLRDGAIHSRPVALVLAYLEGATRSGEFSIPPIARPGSAVDTVDATYDPDVAARVAAARCAPTMPPPPAPRGLDDSAAGLVEKARRLIDSGESDAALRLLSAAIEIDPDFVDAYRLAARLAESMGRSGIAEHLARGAELASTRTTGVPKSRRRHG